MSYGRLFVINVMENAMRLICISNKKCKYRGVDELKFMNDEYLSKNIFTDFGDEEMKMHVFDQYSIYNLFRQEREID